MGGVVLQPVGVEPKRLNQIVLPPVEAGAGRLKIGSCRKPHLLY